MFRGSYLVGFLLGGCLLGTSTLSLANQTAMSVETAALEQLIVHPEYRFSAEIKPHTISTLSSELNTQLAELKVRPGVAVAQNQVLALLNCEDTLALLKQTQVQQLETQANLALTELQLSRLQNLKDQQWVSTSQMDDVRAQQQVLKAALQGQKIAQENAERAVKRCVVKAPYDAVVTRIWAGEGQWLTTGTPVFELYRRDQAEIEVALPLSLAKQYQQTSATWLTQLDEPQTVQWLRQSAVLDPVQRMATVWFVAPNNQSLGLTGTLVLQDLNDYLPVNVLVKRGAQMGIFIKEADQAVFKALESAQEGRPAALPATWNKAWQVVVKGQQRLQSGDALK